MNMSATVALMAYLTLTVSNAAPSVRCMARVNTDQHWSMDCSSLNATDFKTSKTFRPVHNLTLSKNNIENLTLANWTDLRYLDLSFNRIANLTDDVFCCSTHLVHLNLSHNSLEVISPNAFGKLTWLRSLDLSWNPRLGGSQYYDWAGLKLPLSNDLRLLYMSSIGLEHVPADTFENVRALRSLDLSHNSLKHLPVFPETLVNLDLSYNLVEVVTGAPLKRCRSLRWLSFDNNTRLKTIEDGAFRSLVSLASLSLKGCRSLEALPEGLFRNNGEMKNLSLAGCKLKSLPPEFESVLLRLDVVEIHANQWACNYSLKWFTRLNTPAGSKGNIRCATPEDMSVSEFMELSLIQRIVRYCLIAMSLVGLCSLLVSIWVACSMEMRRRAKHHHNGAERIPLYEAAYQLQTRSSDPACHQH